MGLVGETGDKVRPNRRGREKYGLKSPGKNRARPGGRAKKQECRTGRKPNSVPPPPRWRRGGGHLSGPSVALGLGATYPGLKRRGPRLDPVWSCSGRGLPCPLGRPRGGALLPHLFTLACDPVARTHRRYVFCGAFRRRGVAPAPPPVFPGRPALRSSDFPLRRKSAGATAGPPGVLSSHSA